MSSVDNSLWRGKEEILTDLINIIKTMIQFHGLGSF